MSVEAFRSGLRDFGVKVQAETLEIFAEFVTLTHESVVAGSALTGSPGQPVDTGNLRRSWQINWQGPAQADISTNLPYAPSIEDGVSYAHGGTPMTLRSPTGGFHSVAVTMAGADRLLDEAKRRHP